MFQINPSTSPRAVYNALVASKGLASWLQKIATGFGPATSAADLASVNKAVDELQAALVDLTTAGPVLPHGAVSLSARTGSGTLIDNPESKAAMTLMNQKA